MIIIMLGAPGAGKGTQAERICSSYSLPHISTGDIFRANIKGNTDLGREAKSYMDRGELVPDELTVRILKDRVSQEDCKGGYVLDGFPRTIPQAEALDEMLETLGIKADHAIDVEVPDDNIVRRMGGRRSCPNCGQIFHIEYAKPEKEGICDKCGTALVIRDDDRDETVRNRLKVYHEQTQPLIDYYKKSGILKEVDGTRSPDQVFEDIKGILS